MGVYGFIPQALLGAGQKWRAVVRGRLQTVSPTVVSHTVPPALRPGKKMNIGPIPRPPGKWAEGGEVGVRPFSSLFSYWRPQADCYPLPSTGSLSGQPSRRGSASGFQDLPTLFLQGWGSNSPAVTALRIPPSCPHPSPLLNSTATALSSMWLRFLLGP